MNGTMVVIARSMLSKLVHRDEIGKLFSLIAVLESFIPLGIIPVYATVYGLTVQTFSGSVIILSAILTIPPQIIYMLEYTLFIVLIHFSQFENLYVMIFISGGLSVTRRDTNRRQLDKRGTIDLATKFQKMGNLGKVELNIYPNGNIITLL